MFIHDTFLTELGKGGKGEGDSKSYKTKNLKLMEDKFTIHYPIPKNKKMACMFPIIIRLEKLTKQKPDYNIPRGKTMAYKLLYIPMKINY